MFVLSGLAYFYYKKHKRVMRDLTVLEMKEVHINKMVKAFGCSKLKDYETENGNNHHKFISN